MEAEREKRGDRLTQTDLETADQTERRETDRQTVRERDI